MNAVLLKSRSRFFPPFCSLKHSPFRLYNIHTVFFISNNSLFQQYFTNKSEENEHEGASNNTEETTKKYHNKVSRSDLKKVVESDQITKKQVRGAGPGGQHINKTSSCSFMKDNKTGISVKMGKSRDLVVNNAIAKKVLVDKLDLHYNGKESKIAKKIEKAKKQKSKLKKKSQEKHNSPNKGH